jgi:PAS domain S-box-containing protein
LALPAEAPALLGRLVLPANNPLYTLKTAIGALVGKPDRRIRALNDQLTALAAEKQALEHQLHQATELNYRMMESSADCIKLLDLDGNLILMNARGRAAMEISDFELISGRPWASFCQGATQAELLASVEAARAGQSTRFQGWADTLRGSHKCWDVDVSPVCGPDGQPEKVLAVARDITALQQREAAERLLEQSEERLRSALSISNMIGTFHWDVKADLIYADPNLSLFYGVDPAAAAQGMKSAEFNDKVHPDDRSVSNAAVKRLLAGEADYTCVFRVQRPGAPERWLQAEGRPVRYENGVPTHIAGANVDITEAKRAAEALAEAEGRMRLAQEVAGIGTLEVLVETDELIGSDEFFRLFGLPPVGRCPAETVLELILPEDRERLSTVETSAAGKPSPPASYRFRRADTGEIRWVEYEARFRPAEPGRPTGLIGIVRDVTETKRSETRQAALVALGDRLRELRHSGEIAQAASEILGRALDVTRAGHGSVTPGTTVLVVEQDWSAAPTIPSIVGTHDLDHYGTFIQNLIHGEVVAVDDIEADDRTTFATGPLLSIGVRALLNVPLLANGRLVAVWFVHSATKRHWTDREANFLRSAADRVWAAMQRVRAEADLRQLNETLEMQVAQRTRERDQAWKNSRDLQLILTEDGVFRAANDAWASILGWRPEEVVARHFSDFVHPDDRITSQHGLATATEGELTNCENRYRHRDGSYRWFSWVAAMEDGLIYASGRHITAEKEAHAAIQTIEGQLRQSQKMEAVGQLTGGLAHDFNNLLTGITGSLELLQIGIDRGQGADIDFYLETAQSSAKRAVALTRRLLAFSRQQDVEPQLTNIRQLADDMAGLIRSTAGSAIQLEVMGDAMPWRALLDPNQLENVLLNLVINARDAMPGGGALTIAIRNRVIGDAGGEAGALPPGDYISLSVKDTGTGMTPDVLARAFDAFYTTKPAGRGTGLGLTMIDRFVRQCGGRVDIQSEAGRGTEITLLLPRHNSAVPVIEAAPHADDGAIESPPTMNVLVVDDERSIRALLVRVLRDLGQDVIEAADGVSALQILRSGTRIDLLVTDIGLPGGMNGRQLAEIGRTMHAQMKVLFITGLGYGALDDAGALPPGMQILPKPFRLAQLSSRLSALIVPEDAFA